MRSRQQAFVGMGFGAAGSDSVAFRGDDHDKTSNGDANHD